MVVNQRLIRGFFTSIVLLFTCNSLIASAQVTQTRAADISKKYVWKSIYLTYGNICDVTQLLSKPEQLRKISLQPGGAVAPVLKDFLARHKADNQRDGLALLQINLNTLEAGFMKAGDADGVIDRIPWAEDQVAQVAEFFDIFLTDSSRFFDAYLKVIDVKTPLASAWRLVSDAPKSNYVPREKVTFMIIGFRALIERKEVEFKGLEREYPVLVRELTDFKTQFDTAFQKVISPDSTELYLSRLIVLDETLQKDMAQPLTNPYTDPNKAQLLKVGEALVKELADKVTPKT